MQARGSPACLVRRCALAPWGATVATGASKNLVRPESRLRAFVRLTWRSALVLALAAGLGAWLLRCGSPTRRTSDDAAANQGTPQPPPGASPWSPRSSLAPAAGCRPEAARTCVDGDVWWLDSCGEAYALAHECHELGCVEGACERDAPSDCGEVTALGRCRREVAQICQRGRLFEVDCGALEPEALQCVMAGDGPLCRAASAEDCRDDALALCEGSTLKQCREGRWARFDCEALGGACIPGSRDSPGRCAFALPVLDADCGPCGCPPEPSVEICDGKDNDADGVVDQAAPCGAVPIVAFVVEGSDYVDQDLETAIAETNAAFARDDGFGLEFELRSIVRIDQDAWRELDSADLEALLRSDRLVIASDDFYIPVVFTDTVLAASVPRPGLSTVPNGSCGGLRRVWDRQPPVGVVAVAKRRWSTTLAHEIGHFLGLCHTHEAPPPVVQVQSGTDALVDAPACTNDCEAGPDGICDTPTDPGPEQCGVDAECAMHCATGDSPDPSNMMAYYPECRLSFTVQQALLMREALALRRGWHPCNSGDCVCDPAASQCPDQMSCRPFGDAAATTWRCDLDGPAVPGGRCDNGGECGAGSICVRTPVGEGRCARTCDQGAVVPGCACRAITTPTVAVCSEDLRMDR